MSDSRYLTSDSFTLCMETITAVCWGPLCYVVAFCIARSHPLRYPLQAIVSLGQIYGDILYYATAMFDHYHRDIQYCRPEPYYFWFYYFFMNFIWIVIPGCELTSTQVKDEIDTLQICCTRASPGLGRHLPRWTRWQNPFKPMVGLPNLWRTGIFQKHRQTDILQKHRRTGTSRAADNRRGIVKATVYRLQ